MNVDRGDKTDVTRAADIIRGYGSNDSLPNETPEKADENIPPLTFSSERFNFSTFAEDPSIDCIDKAGSMFKELKKKKPPTLREALESMGYGEKTEKLFEMFTEKAKGRLEEIEAPGLSDEDVATIFCYTHEGGVDSPYRKLNQSISVERSNPALRKTRAFLFLLLRALRKLPRYTPANKTLYRGINIHVQTEKDSEHPDRKPYAKGNEKTWWTFTSTTEDLEVTKDFVQNNKNKKGTLFTLSGEAWGYDISVFSNFPNEKEILLEPERRLKIKGVKKEEGAIISVNAEILDTPLVLKDYIKVKPVKIKEKKSKNKEVPRNLRVEDITESTVTLSWDALELYSEKVLSYQVSARQTSDRFINRNPESTYIVRKDETKYTVRNLEEGKEYEFRVRCKYKDGWGKEWSEKVVVKVVPFSKNEWRKCPDYVDKDGKYSVDEGNPRVATMDGGGCCTIIGNTPISPNTVAPWNIKILKSSGNNGCNIWIGAAPFDINQNVNNYNKCGWYFNCFDSTLYSGPPHNYGGKEYGPRKENGEYVHTGDGVGVVVDTTKGDLSFVLNGTNYGAAYEGVPLDKPLVPCVLLFYQGDSVELDTSKVKENEVDSSIPVPSNIIAKSITWDSITLMLDEVTDASFYQVEVDGGISCDIATTSTFTKRGLLPDTEHNFRVRAVRGSSVGEWSGVVKGMTSKESLEKSWWKTCPEDVDEKRKYSVDEGNPRVATMDGDGFSLGSDCTIIGNTPVPLNTITSWNIKILKSENNDGGGIYIGVAPFDINQNVNNYNKCGWYFYCYSSTLYSGPPHKYNGKEYGPRKRNGQYVHTGDSVGVVVDTTKGDLSFVLDGVNLGVAYGGIPLDKPLVPCVVLGCQGDSVELDTSKVKENEVDSSIPVPSNIIVKGTTWDSITLMLDEVTDASFYQVEVDGSKSWGASTTNIFTKRGLLPDTEHNFRVRAVRGGSVSEWSGVVRGRTLKIPIPSNITTKSTTWDSITLAWDEVSDASFYQIEVDGSNSGDAPKANAFTKRELPPETEHSFRVRTVRGGSVSEWSGVVKGKTLEESFENSGWKECPDYVDGNKKYSVNERNPRVATKIYYDNGWCTIIGNTHIPLNKVARWNIKILKSNKNNGGGIYIGIAPPDINQNVNFDRDKCGWYFYCYSSTLYSGSPHNCRDKEYGPREWKGLYVHTGDSVGVVVDTTKGELSFVLNGVNRGAAYCGIPLDKPLVPCVLLEYHGDSVELII